VDSCGFKTPNFLKTVVFLIIGFQVLGVRSLMAVLRAFASQKQCIDFNFPGVWKFVDFKFGLSC